MGRRGIFKSSQEFATRPDGKQYTHVCRLCWPKGREADSQAAGETSQANTGGSTPATNFGGKGQLLSSQVCLGEFKALYC